MQNAENKRLNKPVHNLLVRPILHNLQERCRQEKLNNAEIGIYILGTGTGGQELLQELRAASNENYNIKGFLDNAAEKQGCSLFDLPVTAPDIRHIGQKDFILIASLSYEAEICEQLAKLGFPKDRIIYAGQRVGSHQGLGSHCYVASIDIVDTCNLSCATCPRRVVRGTGNRMSLPTFVQILDKLANEGIKVVGLYNWTEPFLHPKLVEFVKEVKRHQMTCGLSSNLALPKIEHLVAVLDVLNPDDGDELIVTLSGMQQSVYGVNHRGGNIATVKKNLEIASQSLNKSAIKVRLIQFDYNHDEETELAEFCNRLGLSYHVIKGGGNPLTEDDMSSVNLVQSNENVLIPYNRELKTIAPCTSVFDHIVIDYKGDAYLCCMTPPVSAYNLGSFMGQELPVLTLKRFLHPACAICKIARRKFTEADLTLLTEGLKQAGE